MFESSRRPLRDCDDDGQPRGEHEFFRRSVFQTARQSRTFPCNENGFSRKGGGPMGGLGSGSMPNYRGNGNNGGGRRKKQAVAVEGIGVPAKPDGLPDDVGKAWDALVILTSGVTFSQDAELLLECATLKVRQDAFRRELSVKPTDIELNRMSLAVGRALLLALGKLGLTPRDRQVLLVQNEGRDEPDELDKLLSKRRFFADEGGVPNRKRDLDDKRTSTNGG